MKEFFILLKRELKSIAKEKTIMFAILVQFFVASFSSIILVGIMAFYDPGSISQNTHAKIHIGLVDNTGSVMGTYLDSQGIDVWHFTGVNPARRAFEEGKIDAFMVLPENKTGVVDMQLVLPKLDTQQTVILMLLQEPLKNYENFLRTQNGVELHYAGAVGKPSNNFEFLYSLIIPILMLFPALIAGSIMIDTVSEEFQNKTFDTLIAAPVTLRQIFTSKVSAAILTAVFQVVLWAGLLRLNGMVIQNLALVLLIAVIVAAFISFLAALVALYFKDRERAQFIYSIILVILVSATYFLGFSPLNLITVLASGVPQANLSGLLIYPVSLAITGILFFKLSRKLVFSK